MNNLFDSATAFKQGGIMLLRQYFFAFCCTYFIFFMNLFIVLSWAATAVFSLFVSVKSVLKSLPFCSNKKGVKTPLTI
jgi:hypothetical protein